MSLWAGSLGAVGFWALHETTPPWFSGLRTYRRVLVVSKPPLAPPSVIISVAPSSLVPLYHHSMVEAGRLDPEMQVNVTFWPAFGAEGRMLRLTSLGGNSTLRTRETTKGPESPARAAFVASQRRWAPFSV